jgi:CRP-like cAMP-binding protein
LAAAVKIKDFKAGEKIISRGDAGAEMYILKKGSVICEVPISTPAVGAVAAAGAASPPASPPASPSGPAAAADTTGAAPGEDEAAAAAAAAADALSRGVQQFPLGVGRWFGERALLFRDLRAADVFAAEPTSCYTVAAKTFRDVLGNSDEVAGAEGGGADTHALPEVVHVGARCWQACAFRSEENSQPLYYLALLPSCTRLTVWGWIPPRTGAGEDGPRGQAAVSFLGRRLSRVDRLCHQNLSL